MGGRNEQTVTPRTACARVRGSQTNEQAGVQVAGTRGLDHAAKYYCRRRRRRRRRSTSRAAWTADGRDDWPLVAKDLSIIYLCHSFYCCAGWSGRPTLLVKPSGRAFEKKRFQVSRRLPDKIGRRLRPLILQPYPASRI